MTDSNNSPIPHGQASGQSAEGPGDLASMDSSAPPQQFDGVVLDPKQASPWDDADDVAKADSGGGVFPLVIPPLLDHKATVLGDAGALDAPSAAGDLSAIRAAVRYVQAEEVSMGQPIARAEVITGTAYVVRSDGTRLQLKVGDPLFFGDALETTEDGGAGLMLADETRLSLGSEGWLVLDEVVFDPENESGSLHLSMVKGILVLTSGLIAKTGSESMVIEHPLATIGIRGTSGVIEARDMGDVTITLLPDSNGHEGEIFVISPEDSAVLNQKFHFAHVNVEADISQKTPLPMAELWSRYGTVISAVPGNPFEDLIRAMESDGKRTLEERHATENQMAGAHHGEMGMTISDSDGADPMEFLNMPLSAGAEDQSVGDDDAFWHPTTSADNGESVIFDEEWLVGNLTQLYQSGEIVAIWSGDFETNTLGSSPSYLDLTIEVGIDERNSSDDSYVVGPPTETSPTETSTPSAPAPLTVITLDPASATYIAPAGDTQGQRIIGTQEEADYIDAGGGDDVISGDRRSDFLTGGAGNDIICGGRAGDILVGDDPSSPSVSGADQFVYGASEVLLQSHDHILDFQVGIDKIVLLDDSPFSDYADVGFTTLFEGGLTGSELQVLGSLGEATGSGPAILITDDGSSAWVAYRGSDNMLYQVAELSGVSAADLSTNDFTGAITGAIS